MYEEGKGKELCRSWNGTCWPRKVENDKEYIGFNHVIPKRKLMDKW